MTDSGSPPSTIEGAADSMKADAVEAFGALGNETRLAILLALWESYDPYAGDNAVHFSELRERTGVSDSGRFNYHLRKLDGVFVRDTDDGYVLRPTGLHLVQTIIAGSGMKKTTIPPTDVGAVCLRCDSPTRISFRDGWLYYACTECEGFVGGGENEPEGILFSQAFPPAGVANRTPDEVFETAVFRMLQEFRAKIGGVCPRCSGVVDSRFEICEQHDTAPGAVCTNCHRQYDVAVRWACAVCKYSGRAPPSVAAIVHPAVTNFYRDHGVDIGYTVTGSADSHKVLTLMRNHDQELTATDPPRVRVAMRAGGDELRLTFDDHMNVVGSDA